MDLRQRTIRLFQIEQNPDLAPIELQRCKRDIMYWFDWYAYTYDPRNRPNGKPIGVIPFNLYPFQRPLVHDVVKAIKDGEDILIEKSRDMGVTWVVLCIFLHHFLFIPDFAGRMGSRNVNEVDKIGDISTLFEKLRIAHRCLPQFMRPFNFLETRHAPYLRFINNSNRATIVGETSNTSFGRSGRNTATLFDEMAFWDAGDAAWEACGQTSPCRIAVSTPNGSNNRFARMANRKIPDQPQKRTLHWRLHPLHDDAWYALQKTRYTKSGLAREVDISYTLSLEGKVFDEFEYGTHVKTTKALPEQDNPQNLFTPNPRYPIIVSFDFGRVCAAVLGQVDDFNNVDIFHEVVLDGQEGRSQGSTENLAHAVNATLARYDAIHPNRHRAAQGDSTVQYVRHYTGDPSGATKPWQQNEAFSDHDILQQHRLYPLQVDKVIRAKNRLRSGVSLLQTLMSGRYNGRERFLIHNPDKCPVLIQALQGEYRYRVDRNGDVLETIDEKHPYEDVVDNVRYIALQFADNLPPQLGTPERGVMLESPYTFPV